MFNNLNPVQKLVSAILLLVILVAAGTSFAKLSNRLSLSAIFSSFSSPQSVKVEVVDGYNERTKTFLLASKKISLVQSSNNSRQATPNGYYTSYKFASPSIPSGAVVSSVIISVEHSVDN